MSFIEIQDKESEHFLNITLLDILKAVKEFTISYTWSMYELSTVGKQKDGLLIVDLENEVAKTENGLHMTGEDLLEISEKFNQVTDLILIGAKDKTEFVKYEDDSEWKSRFPIVIEIVDGYSWFVYSRDQNIINKLRDSFKYTEIFQ